MMIGQVVDNGIGPVKLLDEQKAYHLMRKGHL